MCSELFHSALFLSSHTYFCLLKEQQCLNYLSQLNVHKSYLGANCEQKLSLKMPHQRWLFSKENAFNLQFNHAHRVFECVCVCVIKPFQTLQQHTTHNYFIVHELRFIEHNGEIVSLISGFNYGCCCCFSLKHTRYRDNNARNIYSHGRHLYETSTNFLTAGHGSAITDFCDAINLQ